MDVANGLDVISNSTEGENYQDTPATNSVNGSSDVGEDASAPELVPETISVADAGNSRVTKSKHLRTTSADEVHDLVCIGFGPASLAIAIALHDSMEDGKLAESPKVLFLEKQNQFAWHAGMLLPGAKMQISFIKDLASLRNPRSHFTFLNYLHMNNRLVDFTNLDTFLPARIEYEDYLRWCSEHFDDVVKYQNEVVSVSPVQEDGPLKIFTVTSRSAKTGVTSTYRTRNVLVAVGGQAAIPQPLPQNSPRVIHSSQYAYMVPQLLKDRSAPVRVAVIGAGQSAAEIFNNVQSLYQNSRTSLIMRSNFLKPSDDSPFVNSIFNPSFIETVYPMASAHRQSLLAEARATNYGVVRLELIEHLYEIMYHQKRTLGVDERKWPHRIMAGRQILSVDENDQQLHVKFAPFPSIQDHMQDGPLLGEEALDVDLIICATGYKRTAHLDILKEAYPLLPATEESILKSRKDRWLVESTKADKSSTSSTHVLEVGRDYGVRFAPGAVASGSGIWLQGCCEATHGLSDTLLSVLATRSGEIVESVFGLGRR
ncbi:L-lysine 6-monooxygenase (NADPH-requiring)-domain-containing protein [Bombardia bombarda]|uniref:L-ornithine N(5)-monooxygenase [NAD(P)H] n=1 Tax=Bombardia bombarda TaxID=252184 RepID=A0AA39X8P4_9PEZI|nr:L-lysine 6-monooxygenase (NADPH-requiring)-domain-containing protein [Bombardia bombarda]